MFSRIEEDVIAVARMRLSELNGDVRPFVVHGDAAETWLATIVTLAARVRRLQDGDDRPIDDPVKFCRIQMRHDRDLAEMVHQTRPGAGK